jgi:hypothetical protein
MLLMELKTIYSADTNISIYKVASGFQCCILHLQLVHHNDPNTAISANAKLAFLVGTQFITSKIFTSADEIDSIVLTEGHREVLKQHLQFTKVSQFHNTIFDYQVISFSLFWEAFYISLK